MRCIGRVEKLSILLLCSFMLLAGCGKKEEVTAAYETENYNKSTYREELFARDLCVVPGDAANDDAVESTDAVYDNMSDSGNLNAEALFNINDSETIFADKIHEQLYPASITKIMTALVAIKYGNLSEITTVSATADAGNFAADEQTCGIHMGDELTLEDLLYGLLLYSGNDTAVAIAEQVGGSVDHFVQMMNDEAQELMATNTHFENPNGLHDENHYTTAYDLYLIFNECLKHEEFVQIITADSYTVEIRGIDGSMRQENWEPTNYYATGDASLPKKAEIIGGKTGTTQSAGNCLILYEKDTEEKFYISIVMGADTKELLYQYMTALIDENIP